MSARILSTGVVALGISTTAAFADVKPADYWNALSELIGATGGQLSAQVAEDGATTTYGNIVINYGLPDSAGSFAIFAGSVFVTENGDGTLSLQYPETVPIMLNGGFEDEAFFVRMTVSGMDSVTTVSGTPDEIVMSSSYSDATFTLDDFGYKDEWDSFSKSDLAAAELTGSISGGSSTTVVSLGDLITITSQSQSGPTNVSYNFEYDFEFFGGKVFGTEYVGETSGDMSLSLIPGGFDLLAINDALKSGFGFSFASQTSETRSFQQMISDYFLDGRTDASTDTSTITNTGPQATEFAFGADGITLSFDADDFEFSVAEQSLGTNFAFGIAGMGMALDIPIMASTETQDVRFAAEMTDLVIDETTISMFEMFASMDPEFQGLSSEALSYLSEPMSLEYDIAAKVALGFDVFDFEVYETIDPDNPPIDVTTLIINRLFLKAFGAMFDAGGAFEVDLSDFETYGDFPKLVGDATATVTGLNTVLDTLTELGIVSPDDLMPVRMGIGMFTTVSGDDELTSTVELTEEGQVFVNGQRMK